VELLLRLAADDVAVVDRLDGGRRHVGVDQRVPRRLGEQLRRAAIVLAEPRQTHPDHRDTPHGSSSGRGQTDTAVPRASMRS
jgi:hypothetical protein